MGINILCCNSFIPSLVATACRDFHRYNGTADEDCDESHEIGKGDRHEGQSDEEEGREQDRNGQESQGRCLQRKEGEDSLRPEARTPDDQQTGQGGE